MWFMMEVPWGFFSLILLHIFTGCSADVLVTSCDSCHDEAICLESRERGDSFTNQALSCVCKDGFVGDGITCYDTKLCRDSSCCSQGHYWSPYRGCVDIDECSLPHSPCPSPQICYNTPGSFECMAPSHMTRSAVSSSESFQFSCEGRVCPLGMDCIRTSGSARCADPCEHYTVLNDEWRSTNNSNSNVSALHCDRNVVWQGWYRLFLGQYNAQIPEWCVPTHRCGTHAPMWITEPHPTQSNVIVNRTVCNVWTSGCCTFGSHNIHVKRCYGNFYVYKLVQPVACHLAYCAEVNTTNPGISFTTVQPPPLQPSQLICGRDKIQVGLHVSSMVSSGLDPFSGNLAALNCSWVRVQNDTVWYEVDTRAGACGNILRTNSTDAIYSNSLFIYPNNNSSFAPPVSLPFSCVYPLNMEARLDVAIRPSLSLEGGSSGSTKARASMSLFRNSNYTTTYPAGRVTLPVGSPLYVGVSVDERDPIFAVVLEDCFASHSSSPAHPTQYPLIQNRCSTDRRRVAVTESGSSLRARFSALFFLLDGEYRDIYLHCSLSLCDRSHFNCIPSCSSRTRRSVSSSESVQPVTIGPIVWDESAE